MFPNCIDRFGRKKRETKVQQTNKQTNKEKPRKKKRKMGIIVPTMNHYPRNGQEGDLEFSTR